MSARKRANRKRTKNEVGHRNGSRRAETKGQAPRPVTNAVTLSKLRDWLLPSEAIFADLRLHGNTGWAPSTLIWLALCWGWSESKNVTDAFAGAVKQCGRLGLEVLGTYQGFMNALVTWTDRLMAVLWPILHERMRQIGSRFYRIDGWVPIAFDGSRATTPRTESNEKAFCAPNYGKGKTAKYRKKKTKGMRRRKNRKSKPQPQQPQTWITMLWHMGLRLPWMWRLGPSNSSERAHVMEMLDEGDFSENTLFCGDAGFVGYPLWSRIVDAGHHFLVRVGANVNLLTELVDFDIKKNGVVICWPKSAVRSGQPPLRLRLVKVKIGKTSMWILTSVRQSSRLTKSQIVDFYKRRWGVEVEFRGLKQTLDHAELRCRNHQRVLAELNWSIMAMAVAELFALKEQLAPARCETKRSDSLPDPKKRSLANTVRALRECLSDLNEIPDPGQDLLTQLRLAVTDSYIRKSSKKARYHPPNPDKKPLGDPTIRSLDAQERKKLDAINRQIAA